MRRFQKATIKEVARQAGVSVTTVSLFVGGRESVCSSETAERIRRAVSELNDTPSSLVSSVQRRATRTFGVCMLSPLDPDVDFGGHFSPVGTLLRSAPRRFSAPTTRWLRRHLHSPTSGAGTSR